MTDAAATEQVDIAGAVDVVGAVDGGDPGGVAFDDDFDDEAPDAGGDRAGVPGAPAYDSASVLQERGIGFPSATPAGMTALRQYVTARWGGADLGCLARPPRAVRGGASPSLHSWGMAWDWRWAGPGPGRAAADEVIEFCLANAGALGIQGVHDYAACRYWKSYRGWKDATPSGATGFGQPWAQWLHVERTWAAANDGRGIEVVLGQAGTPAATGTAAATTVLPDPVLRVGDQGANVARLQDFVRFFGFADFARSDGVFGPRTKGAVERAQGTFAERGWYTAKIDGEYGPKSAAAAAQFLASMSGG